MYTDIAPLNTTHYIGFANTKIYKLTDANYLTNVKNIIVKHHDINIGCSKKGNNCKKGTECINQMNNNDLSICFSCIF